MYKVVRMFKDSKNNDHLYKVGDPYPVAGYKPSKARIEELVAGTNRNGKVYLEVVEDDADTPSVDGTTEGTPEE